MIVSFRPLIFSKNFTCFHNMIYLNTNSIKNKNNIITEKMKLPTVCNKINYVNNNEFLNLVENYGQRTVIEIHPKITEKLEKLDTINQYVQYNE